MFSIVNEGYFIPRGNNCFSSCSYFIGKLRQESRNDGLKIENIILDILTRYSKRFLCLYLRLREGYFYLKNMCQCVFSRSWD